MPTLRKRLLVDEWVILAPERAGRPRQLALDDAPGPQKAGDTPCPFCLAQGELTPAPTGSWDSPDFPDHPWGVRTVPNKFPALDTDADFAAYGDALYEERPARGVHEVIVESPCHQCHWEEFPNSHLATIYGSWRDRLGQLGDDPANTCGVIFKNQGARAGASLDHVHSQLATLPMVPPTLAAELRGSKAYFDHRGDCALCAMIARERRSQERLVAENSHFIAIAPYGSRVPFEIWILPILHRADFRNTPDSWLSALAEMTARILALWRPILGSVAHNMVLHTAPFDLAAKPYYHWHVEMLPRHGQVAGFEWATNNFINAIPSEVAARRLRNLNI